MSITLKMADGDLVVDSAGRHINIEGAEKLAQDVAEAQLNNFDPEFPTYFNGSELYRIQGEPVPMNDIWIQERIRTFVQESIDRLIAQQDEDPYTDDEERIDFVQRIDVFHLGSLTYAYYLIVVNDSQDAIPTGFQVSLLNQLPGSLADDLQQRFNDDRNASFL